jgi:hypothetical protein
MQNKILCEPLFDLCGSLCNNFKRIPELELHRVTQRLGEYEGNLLLRDFAMKKSHMTKT